MRKYKHPARYTHCVYFRGEKIASIVRAYADINVIAWHVDFYNYPRYGAICRAILEAAKHVQSHKNVLIYEH